MNISETSLPGVYVITPDRFGDSRGFFSESYSARSMAAAGIDDLFVQDNHSLSAKAGTVRGLHFQAPPHAQTKLVRCGQGALFDVAVDIRKGSPTYGSWTGEVLSAENGKQLLVPAGFLHGFMTLKDATEIIYKCTDYYAPQTEGAVRFDDPEIGITWPDIGDAPTLSEKDAGAPGFGSFANPFIYEARA